MTTRAEAKRSGLKRYVGKVCAKHPELNGERYTASKKCIACAREGARVGRMTAEQVERKNERNQARRADPAKRERGNAQERERRSAPEYRERRNAHEHSRRATDPLFHLAKNLRLRVRAALAGRSKSASTIALLGCSIEELHARLERQFEPGMTWENYGRVWHVDHVVPLATFGEELVKPEVQRVAFGWQNLRPLFSAANTLRGFKMNDADLKIPGVMERLGIAASNLV